MIIEIHFPETFHAFDGFYPKSTEFYPSQEVRGK
jgi:hypothetical protein